MTVLTLDNISKTFGPVSVLDAVSFVVNAGERVGLAGANGAGKSTLLRIIAGEIEPDGGRVRVADGVEVGHLPQSRPVGSIETVQQILDAATGDLPGLERRLRELEPRLGRLDGDALDRAMREYGDVLERFERRGGYDLEHRQAAALAGLGLGDVDRGRRFQTLSGGEQARVLLAGLLLRGPDLLLLDEPTNDLDAASTEWLEAYLASYRGTLLVVSHDRQLLNRTVTRMLEVDEHSGQVAAYPGGYDAYRAAKARAREQWERDYERQQEEIRSLQAAIKVRGRQVAHNRPPTDNDKFGSHFFGERVQQAISRNVRSAEERLRRIEAEAVPRPPRQPRINPDFDPAELRSDRAVALDGVSVSIGGRPVLRDVWLSVGPRERIVVVGENGAGKSTLLALLAGRRRPDAGRVVVAPGARIGFLDQDGASLDSALSLLDAFRDGLVGSTEQLLNTLFSFGLFRPDDLGKRVGQLSLGQRRKLQLARLIADRANLLLLDEPTNHLSFDVLEGFERALREFPGPIVAVSHDRWFVERFGGAVWRLERGTLSPAAALESAGLTSDRAVGSRSSAR